VSRFLDSKWTSEHDNGHGFGIPKVVRFPRSRAARKLGTPQFDHFHIFDLFCTSTHQLYYDRNFTCTSRPIRCPYLKKGRSSEAEVREVELMRTHKILFICSSYVQRTFSVNYILIIRFKILFLTTLFLDQLIPNRAFKNCVTFWSPNRVKTRSLYRALGTYDISTMWTYWKH